MVEEHPDREDGDGGEEVVRAGCVHDLWNLTRAQLRTIFMKSDIAHIMGSVLNAPDMRLGEQSIVV